MDEAKQAGVTVTFDYLTDGEAAILIRRSDDRANPELEDEEFALRTMCESFTAGEGVWRVVRLVGDFIEWRGFLEPDDDFEWSSGTVLSHVESRQVAMDALFAAAPLSLDDAWVVRCGPECGPRDEGLYHRRRHGEGVGYDADLFAAGYFSERKARRLAGQRDTVHRLADAMASAHAESVGGLLCQVIREWAEFAEEESQYEVAARSLAVDLAELKHVLAERDVEIARLQGAQRALEQVAHLLGWKDDAHHSIVQAVREIVAAVGLEPSADSDDIVEQIVRWRDAAEPRKTRNEMLAERARSRLLAVAGSVLGAAGDADMVAAAMGDLADAVAEVEAGWPAGDPDHEHEIAKVLAALVAHSS